MYKAKIIASHNCWASRISREFPGHDLALNNTLWLEDKHAMDVFSVRAESDAQFDAILRYLRAEKTIARSEMLERGKTYMFVQVDTYSPQPIIRQVYNCHCFQLAPILLKSGNEIWTLGAVRRENLKKAFEAIKKLGSASLKFIAPTTYDKILLTEKQRIAFNMATMMGYYELPRKITVTKLAKAARVSKTAFLEHLRKAEIKILGSYAGSHDVAS